MAGAVSAGAYTAGVIDFLIDALDTLYAQRQEQQSQFGDDVAQWEIPAHEVRIVVMSGASAGGMVSAIAGAALNEKFTPMRSETPAPAPNRLYKGWVEDIDIQYLLGSKDLKDTSKPVVSILDSSQLDVIAADAIRVVDPLPEKRPYIADPLKLTLTLTNLKGIPYATEAGSGNTETQTLYHSDQANFDVRWQLSASTESALQLTPHSPENWPALAEAAKATGAFPIALAPRVLDRSTTIYNNRLWRISRDESAPVDGVCQSDNYETMRPNGPLPDGIAFKTLNVDGGVTNNDPFECAHQVVSQQEPAQPAGHNPRSAQDADRAVVSIAPFLSSPAYTLGGEPEIALTSVAGQLLSALINQSRIQGENIKLTAAPDVFTRWAISPSIDDTHKSALASASLSAFGGFLAKEFRHHDYQLGRRNCQQFLMRHFLLPLDNVVIKDYPLSQKAAQDYVTQLPNGVCQIPIIPVLPALQPEIREIPVKISQDRIFPIADLASDRLKLVASRIMLRGEVDWLKTLAFKGAWALLEGELKRVLLNKIGYDLARQDLIL